MPGLGGEGGVEGLAHAGEGVVGVEGGAAVGPFQLEGGDRQAGLVAEGDHAGEAGVGAQTLDMGAAGVVEDRLGVTMTEIIKTEDSGA